MKSIIVTAKTIERAIEDGLEQLGTTLENVDINIISEGGFLQKAKVELTLSEDAIDPIIKKKTAEPEEDLKTVIKEEIKSFKKDITEQSVEIKTEKSFKPEVKTNIVKIENTEEKPNKVNTVKVNDKEITELSVNYIKEVLNILNLPAEIKTEDKDGDLYINLTGENLGNLIGYHGEALEAIQFLLNNYLYTKTGTNKKVYVNVENYREKREVALKDLANNIANKVLTSRRRYKLEPMNSFERRIIHTHLQTFTNIRTHSEGQEPNRYLVIEYID